MKTVIATLQLSTSTSDRTRERCPRLVFANADGVMASIRSDVEAPHLPFGDGSINTFHIHDDALSRVIDEEVWLAEIARVLAVGGEIRLTLPAENALAWLDAMNLYRYITDITSRGDAPDASLPTGWNRHYRQPQVQSLLEDAGFESVSTSLVSHAGKELALVSWLLAENWINGDRQAEVRRFPTLGRRDPSSRRHSPWGTTWVVSARKRGTPQPVPIDRDAENAAPDADPSE